MFSIDFSEYMSLPASETCRSSFRSKRTSVFIIFLHCFVWHSSGGTTLYKRYFYRSSKVYGFWIERSRNVQSQKDCDNINSLFACTNYSFKPKSAERNFAVDNQRTTTNNIILPTCDDWREKYNPFYQWRYCYSLKKMVNRSFIIEYRYITFIYSARDIQFLSIT